MNYTPEDFKKIVLQKLACKMKSRATLAIGIYKNPEDYAEAGKDIYLARLWKIENDNIRPYELCVVLDKDESFDLAGYDTDLLLVLETMLNGVVCVENV